MNLSLDLETFGTSSNAAIVSIGACIFCDKTNSILGTFYRVIDADSAVKYGKVDGSTVLWWMQQSDEARVELVANGVELEIALHDFSSFIAQFGSSQYVKVWGNGPTFDNVILGNAYKSTGIEQPWKFWNDRCVRTIVDTCKVVTGKDPKKLEFTGEAHNSKHDAIHQAKMVMYSLEQIKHNKG